MKKKNLIMLLLIAALSVSIISLYTTFAYDEEAALLNESQADYNLIYSVKEKTDQNISVNAKEEKFIDIVIKNTYKANLKYGMYYKLVNPKEMPQNITIAISEDSVAPSQNIIKAGETKTISVKINNKSDENIDLVVGALVGFEQGKIEDLTKEGEILIK